MKVLITTDLYTTNTNGVVTSVQNLFDELTAKGHDVRILTISDTLHSHQEGAVTYIRSVSMEKVYPNVRMPVSYRHKLIQEIIDWKPDVVHSQCEFFSFQFASRISKITGAPIVHTYHTLYEQYMTSYLIPNKRLGDYLVKVLNAETGASAASFTSVTIAG
jgi:1,2-diacylglycerol 3-alpha-glucosyltransferase